MLTVVIAVAAAAVAWWSGRSHQHTDTAAPTPAPKEALVGGPKDRLIGFSLDQQPVPAWQISTEQIGLPPGFTPGKLFAAVGDRAYFLSTDCGRNNDCNGYVYGVNSQTGELLFAPILLPTFYGDDRSCLTNGPTVAVCVNPDCPEPAQFCKGHEQIWIIDLEHGAITFNGRPEVHQTESTVGPRLEPIGNYRGVTRLVAVEKGKGVHGVGDHGELTWFLPGSGDITQANKLDNDGLPPITLAVQTSPGRGEPNRVFSIDGKDLTPTPPEGKRLRDTAVYIGGFAYEYLKDDGISADGVGLYDDGGQLVTVLPDALYPQRNVGMPTVVSGGIQLYTSTGHPVSTLQASVTDDYKTIGASLYIGIGEHWTQFDIRTGKRGATCEMTAAGPGYVGSDGTTVIWLNLNDGVANPHFDATDATTCQTRWSIPSPTYLYQAGTALLAKADDTLTGLRAPQ